MSIRLMPNCRAWRNSIRAASSSGIWKPSVFQFLVAAQLDESPGLRRDQQAGAAQWAVEVVQ